ncbi:MAG: valine--tRNA ligase [Cystobacterineae bacterium]|nr:valine--tRNA ligase [Cystobacterineae bacterium]
MNGLELPKSYEPSQVEERWYAWWLEKAFFRAEASSAKPPYCIVLPPPNVTGSLHLGHVLPATLQDILVRHKRMKGHNVLWLPGIDHAGIATQTVVERELKKNEGLTRFDLGREEFLKRVWQWKDASGNRIAEQHKLLGASLDWSRERFTLDESSSTAVREAFVRLHEEGLIYRAQKLIHWDPSLRTALSDLEVEHEECDGFLWHIAYPVKDSEERLVVATTRPETLLGDVAVAVHPEDERFAHWVGKTLLLPLLGREIPVIADAEWVNKEFGTGAVKVTPAHDPVDYLIGLKHGLSMISIFDEAACTNENAGPYAGMDRFEARKKVVADLIEQGLLVKEEPYRLSLAVSQRSGVPVEPRLCLQWFVRVEPLAQAAIEAVEAKKTQFYPESWTNTFYAWMRNIHDWCISRQLWWGHQIPAWYSLDTSPKLADGSIDFERATPVVSRENPGVTADNPSGNWVKDPDVLDTWFSSGLWPFSTLGWPNPTKELETFYPNAVMETGHDILFFWVARMMMLGIHFMKEVPFSKVYLHAMIRDEKGEKMSKVKGNVVDPLLIIRGAPASELPSAIRSKFPQGMAPMGADALRFTLASLTQQGREIRLPMERVNGYRAFCNKLYNAARFALMNFGEFEFETLPSPEELSLADGWMLSRLNRLIKTVDEGIENFQFSETAMALYHFVWRGFCDWYIEFSKGIFSGDDEAAKRTTRACLAWGLEVVLRLLHPFMPFITEEIWQMLPMRHEAPSICVAPFPQADSGYLNEPLELEMGIVMAFVEAVRSIRGENNIPPSKKIQAIVQSDHAETRALLEKQSSVLVLLAGLSELSIQPMGDKPKCAGVDFCMGMEVFIPLEGVVDLQEERLRIQREMSKAEKDLGGLLKKLENPNFVARAPQEVLEKDKTRIEELQDKLQKMSEHLQRISPSETEVSSRVAEVVAEEDIAGVVDEEENKVPAETLEEKAASKVEVFVFHPLMPSPPVFVLDTPPAPEVSLQKATAAAQKKKAAVKKPVAKKSTSTKPAVKKTVAGKAASAKPSSKKPAATKLSSPKTQASQATPKAKAMQKAKAVLKKTKDVPSKKASLQKKEAADLRKPSQSRGQKPVKRKARNRPDVSAKVKKASAVSKKKVGSLAKKQLKHSKKTVSKQPLKPNKTRNSKPKPMLKKTAAPKKTTKKNLARKGRRR